MKRVVLCGIIYIMSLLYKIFPPPKFLEMPAYGLDISDRTLKFIKLIRTPEGLRISNFGNKVIPEGLIVSGEIIKQEELAGFLKESCVPQGIRYIISSLPEEKAYLSAVELPMMATSNIKQVLEVQLSEHIPLPPGEVNFDFEIIEKTATSLKPQHLDVMIAAAPSKLVSSYYETYQKAGLEPVGFDLEMHAIARACIPKNSRDTYLIMDFGRTRTSFIIVSEKQVRFASTTSVSGKNIDKAISKAFGVSILEAERIKKERASLLASSPDEKMYEIVLPIVSALRDELSKLIDFWETHAVHVHFAPSRKIKKILLCGGETNMYGLNDYLSHTLNIDVEYVNVWTNVASFDDFIPPILFKNSLKYASAIGLALRAV
ncbi:MAG: hypothetical protein COU46_02875 [Candidatus Niyogibacteria bacterium CG10_big_fil_rev_8_21_14_0_10_42_19]|uniref:SHS2 domain-containing protein n=1 Tax=Candidatus Niyogibacteria bacterium CG10_big_fil_rev_8_21_14_0_10_42_19 TaxID=1974725 RepID=A0A2H0TF61_9BACT|nr:MAG: hypothetical protein COU46_02875 [Candidatus Niyogibacteria bacterium CG10_big_fil_rev_8_21_14_0_10_42_19]